MIQAIRCLLGYHGKTVTKEYLGFMDLYDMEVCEFCEKPTTGKHTYDRLDGITEKVYEKMKEEL